MQQDELTSKLRGFAMSKVVSWVRRQRERYRSDPRSGALRDDVRAALRSHFLPELLERARFVTLRAERAERPAFFDDLRAFGVSEAVLTSFTNVAAITYQDVVIMPSLHPGAENLPLIFHELVHVVQYDDLGLEGFLGRYLDGWFSARGRHSSIPLEMDAYALEKRFVEGREAPFDVRAEVKRLLQASGSPDAAV